MRRTILPLLALSFALAVSVSTAAAETVNVSIGKDLPEGMKVFVAVVGDGGNCSGAASATVGSGGTVTVTIEVRCEPSGHPPTPGPNANVRIAARALDEPSNTQYKGEGRLTATSVANVYQSRFNMSKVPPRP